VELADYDDDVEVQYSGNLCRSNCIFLNPTVFCRQTYKEADEEAAKETSVWCIVTVQGR